MSAAVPPRSEGTDVTDNKTFLGTEPVGKLLRKLAVPTVIAQLVNMLYNIVDRIYIGHMPGDGSLALTGVGVCLPIIMVISAFAALISSGGAPRASIAMGRGDMETAQKLLGGCFMLQVAISAVLTAVLLVWSRDLLLAFGASANTIDYAADYMRVYAVGTLFVQLTLGMNAFITAQGFAKVGMTTVLIGAAANIALDPVFIFALGMGVRGAALATILSQGLSCVWVLRFLTGKRTLLHLRREDFFIPARLLLPCISLGLATFVMQSSESVISVCFNASLLKYGGDIAVGAMTILSSVMQFALLPLQGIAQGSQPAVFGGAVGTHHAGPCAVCADVLAGRGARRLHGAGTADLLRGAVSLRHPDRLPDYVRLHRQRPVLHLRGGAAQVHPPAAADLPDAEPLPGGSDDRRLHGRARGRRRRRDVYSAAVRVAVPQGHAAVGEMLVSR